MTIVNYSFPTQILFGAQARNKLSENLKLAGKKRPLLITDKIVSSLKIFEEIKNSLNNMSLDFGLIEDNWGNPEESHVKKCVTAYKEHNSDSVIAIGGGSVLDIAKAVLLMSTHSGNLFDYEEGIKNARPIDNKILPYFVALPTTAGTGSEVGRSAVISDDITKIKKIIFTPGFLPQTIFADPELSLSLPANVTASTGMDALTHCIEAYLAKGFQPFCDGIALEGIRLISKSLVKCVNFAKENAINNSSIPKEEELYYRGLMLNSSMMGAVAFQKGLGVNHSCAHSLSITYNLHHGLANGVLLPYTMKFNAEKEEEKFTIMASCAGLGEKTKPDDFITWLTELNKEIGIPEKLSALGVNLEKIDTLVEHAFADPCHLLNPRPLTKEFFKDIFIKAI